MFKKITLSLLMAVATLSASAQVPFLEGTPTPEEVLAKGKSEEKFIFMDLHATWCPPCRMMERDVFSRADLGGFMGANFVNVKYNIDESVGKKLADEYRVASIPTYLIFNSEGKLVSRMTGARSAEEFMAEIQRVLSE